MCSSDLLLGAIPRFGGSKQDRLPTIRGTIPDPRNQPSGCVFHTRCPEAVEGLCDTTVPRATLTDPGRRVRCLLREHPHVSPEDVSTTPEEATDAD